MIVYRISSFRYHLDLSGKGAELHGGRWNSKGLPALYTADSRALAMAEVAVHLPIGAVASNYRIVALKFPDDELSSLPNDSLPETWKTLPETWRSFPYDPKTQLLGDEFLKNNKHLALKVPSAVVDGDFNIIINPMHQAFKKLEIIEAKPFMFDIRFLKF